LVTGQLATVLKSGTGASGARLQQARRRMLGSREDPVTTLALVRVR